MRPNIVLLALAPLAACATIGNTGRTFTFPAASATAGRDTAASPRADIVMAPVPRRNERVRVVFPATPTQPERYLGGYLQRLVADTVIMARGLVADTVTLGQDRSLQAVVRSRGHAWTGFAIGAFVGGVAGAALGAASYQPCQSTELFGCLMAPSSGEAAAGGAIGGALLGGLVGALIGTNMRTVEWATVPLTGARASIGPSGISLRASF